MRDDVIGGAVALALLAAGVVQLLLERVDDDELLAADVAGYAAGARAGRIRALARLRASAGAGIGLTFDEAALLLDLRDVYWTREGLLSVQLSLGATAILSIAILTQRMLRRGERSLPDLAGAEAVAFEPPQGF